MKKMIFVVLMFLSLILFADETNWISYDDWVTGPGSEDNKYTYLLPFGYFSDNACSQTYMDEYPLLYETDMGCPVPNEDESALKYLFFGDTYFFMRDEDYCVTSKLTGPRGTILLNFDINEDLELCTTHEIAEIEKKYNFSPSSGTHLKAMCLRNCPIAHPNYTQEQCEADCADISANCSDCINFCVNPANSYVWSYFGVNNLLQCWNFCMFDTVDTYASRGYFVFDKECVSEENNDLLANYNKGTSNIFLAATLETTFSVDDGYRYNIKFQDNDETGSNSAQLYETTSGDPRKAKSVWMNAYEKDFAGNIGIYPRGYFYACAGSPSDGCTSKKLFVPYKVNSWNFLTPNIFCKNVMKNINNQDIWLVGDTLSYELERQKQSIGFGIYDFEDECRVKFSQDSAIPNQFFPYSFPSCDTSGIDDGCYQEPAYPNRNILWPNLSKMSNITVIHDIDLDILSIDDKDEYAEGYIYFMGTGEAEIYTDHFSMICNADDSLGMTFYHGYNQNTITKTTQKAYIARVPAYESEIKCAAAYEYFAGITNGISRWTKDMNEAEPLYGFYPLQGMGAESIVKHRDLYWMTAPLNETYQKGFVVLASPDALHWQKVDTILFDNPDSIWLDYAFFWLPPKLIENSDNTMPFLYSIWKNHTDPNTGKYTLSGFLDPTLAPQFTRYNLKSGKYKFMENEKTRAFLVDNVDYGSLLRNTIPIHFIGFTLEIPVFNYSSGAIPLSFNTFQNLENLDNTGWTSNTISEEKAKLKNRYVIIEYCNCRDQAEELCKSSEGFCPPHKNFVTEEEGNGEDNWKIIDIVNDNFFDLHVRNCEGWNSGVPHYLCNIPFEHGRNIPKGQKNTPVWNWRDQIAKDYPTENKDSANVILRFSHWYNLPFIRTNYTEINKQLMENSKLVPFDCNIPGLTGQIRETCESPSSWRTSKMIYLRYKTPEIDENKLRLEYLYPYPVIISDYGKPGDPAPDVWDMLVADHFAKEFFKVSSFEYATSTPHYLTSGAAATAVIKNGQMQIYAWGGSVSLIPRSTSLAGILYVGTYNPETELVTFESEILDETDSNSPVLTAGASMVYDDENDEIYLIGALDQNGFSRIYRLAATQSDQKKWEPLTTIELGRYFRLVKKSEREYFAFGGEISPNNYNRKVFLINLDNISLPKQLSDIPVSGLANSFAAYNERNGKLYVYGGLDSNGASDRFLSLDTRSPNANWVEINAAGGPGAGYGGVILVDYITETISLGGGVFVNSEDNRFKWTFDDANGTWTKELKSGSYCLKETGSTLQGGIETSGECVPFTHPWYNSFSAGATVYSLDGKGERLYVGTNNAIKVYDISDPILPVLVSSFSTNSRVNDLEVYGNTLFAATNGGLYKLDASNDTLTQTLFVSAFLNSQYKVEVYNGKLYVGEDNGIKVRDLDTLSVLTSVNNGSVLDFAIENGEIGLYKDALFSPVEIRDAETLTLKANEFFGCFEIEVGSSDGRFYLSCDDETYRFEDDGDGGISFTELSGDIRELQDVYTYDGYTYLYDENTIWISTSNDVPALCGNGIVEGDEVCDGGQIDCEELDSNYVSGTATCNSTCDGYNTNNCSDDGW